MNNSGLMVGSSETKFKGIDEIIKSYKLIKKNQPDIQLYWITQSQPPVEYQKEVDAYFVSPAQNKIAELYKEAEVYVSASHYESFPLPPLEAMACGCPVVTTGNIGVLEYARDNYNALIAEIGNTKDISNKILEVLRHEGLSRKLIDNGFKTVQKFSWENIILQLLQYFKEVALYNVNKD